MSQLTHTKNSSKKAATEAICITMTDLPVGGTAYTTHAQSALLSEMFSLGRLSFGCLSYFSNLCRDAYSLVSGTKKPIGNPSIFMFLQHVVSKAAWKGQKVMNTVSEVCVTCDYSLYLQYCCVLCCILSFIFQICLYGDAIP